MNRATLEVGSKVYLPDSEGSPPFGPRALNVSGRILEISGNLAFVRWTHGPDLRRLGVGGGWYEREELRVEGC